MSLAKFSMGSLDHSFLEFLEHPVKLKIFHVLATVAKSNVEAKWANEENQIFLNKNDPTASRSFDYI